MQKFLLVVLLFLLTGCKNLQPPAKVEYESIATSAQTYIYEQPNTRIERLETLKEGDKLVVLQDPKNKWLKVRTPSGKEGWVESRDVLKRQYLEEWQGLKKQLENKKPQMIGHTSDDVYLRLRPGRETIKVYKMIGAKELEIFSVVHIERIDPTRPTATPTPKSTKIVKEEPPKKKERRKKNDSSERKFETWYLVKTKEGSAGWIYASLVNIAVDEEALKYVEGKPILTQHILSVTKDEEEQEHPCYLLVERDDRSNQDFERVRVLIWNLKRDRYEVSFRLNINGLFPIDIQRVDPGEPGHPSFKLHSLNPDNPQEIIVDEYQVIGNQTKKVGHTVITNSSDIKTETPDKAEKND